MKYLSYIFFRILILCFSLFPFWLLYLISDVVRFFFYHILRYRIDVINKNLAYCFPNKSVEERKQIAKDYYKNFIDIILESIKGLATDPQKLIPRYKFRNPELMDAYHERGESIIIYSQHYNNWEWAPICLGLQMKHHLVGVIKVISNKYINDYMIHGRSGNNVSVIPTYHTARYFNKLHELASPVGIVFIADQKPSGNERKDALNFLGGQAHFHAGAAKYALKSGLAVFSLDIHRIKRGHYEVIAQCLAKAGEYQKPEDLTLRYKQNLEALIVQSPSSWLWSHKRFKESISY